MRVFSVLFLHFACSFILQAKFIETKVNFTENMLPYLSGYTSINSTSIGIGWFPSPNITGIDLTQLSGTIDASIYVGYRSSTYSATTTYPVIKLNETGKIVLTGLH